MGAEAGIDDELFAVLGFGELEEEDAGGEVVDIGEAEGDELGGELVGDDLREIVSNCSVVLEACFGSPSRPRTRSAASWLQQL